MENLFSQVRDHCHQNTDPTPIQFASIFRALWICGLSSPRSLGENCIEDDGDFLPILLKFIEQDTVELDISNFEFPLTTEQSVSLSKHVERGCKLEHFISEITKKLELFKDCRFCKFAIDSLTTSSERYSTLLNELEDLVVEFLSTSLHHYNLTTKCVEFVHGKIDFSLFYCSSHRDSIISFLVKTVLILNIEKVTTFINAIFDGKKQLLDTDANKFILFASELHKKNNTKKSQKSQVVSSQ